MNKNVKYAMEINEFNNILPDVEIGEQVQLRDVWDGEGDVPTQSYSYLLRVDNPLWINYSFEMLSKKEYSFDSVIKITDIELL